MAKWIGVLDTWFIMLVTSVFVAAGLANGQAILRNYSASSWQEVALCLLAGMVGFWVAVRAISGGGSLGFRLLLIGVVSWILWFQATPWFGLDDSARVRGSFEYEFMMQRLEQVGLLLLVAIPLVGLGSLRNRGSLLEVAEKQNNIRRSVPLAVLLLMLFIFGVITRFLATSDGGLAVQVVLMGAFGAMVIFELARRSADGDRGILAALALIAVGLPIVSFWQV
jgi:hypothetical protein